LKGEKNILVGDAMTEISDRPGSNLAFRTPQTGQLRDKKNVSQLGKEEKRGPRLPQKEKAPPCKR